MKNDLHFKLTVRLFTDQKCFGPGLAELLHNVQTLKSLRAAAQSMEMAYSKAWTVIRKSEAALGFALLQSSTGGKNGGGAVLTAQAEQMLAAYDAYCEELRQLAGRLFEERFAFYDAPAREAAT